MDGLANFVKVPFPILVSNIFKLYDVEKEGSICEEKFITMMLNYPYAELEAMLPRNMRYSHRSREAFHSTIINQPPNLLRGAQGGDSHDTADESTFRQRTPSLMVEYHAFEREETAERLSKTSAASRQPDILPTSVNNKIKFWARQQFRQYARSGRMYLDAFQNWALNNHPFVNRFKKFFRTSWWLEYEDHTTKQRYLSFYKKTLNMKTRCRYSFQGAEFVQVKIGIVDSLLLIFVVGQMEMPQRVVLMKELTPDCYDLDLRICFTHKCQYYPNFTLGFNNSEDYQLWKKLAVKYSKASFRSLYHVIKRLGNGKFSTVFLVQKHSEQKNGRTSQFDHPKTFAAKKVVKSKLQEDEKEILL